MNLLDKLKINHRPRSGALDLLKYIGPGLLVTVGFIDPGNWATNLAAGSEFGYALLWVVTFSSVMLIIIQHNVAHLGIVTGLCLSEATNKYMPRVLSRPILGSAMLASISTSLAEILGGAIALRMLFGMPIKAGSSPSYASPCYSVIHIVRPNAGSSRSCPLSGSRSYTSWRWST